MCVLLLQGFDPESPDPQAHLIDQPYQKPSAQPASAGTQLSSDAMTERRMVPAADLKAKAKEWLPAVSGLPVCPIWLRPSQYPDEGATWWA